ncbi:MAG: hypothetical protein P1P89_13815 [Desulfobacterales bacterium]|nr:hypothetical protein [Desulfobacterales bacterium]
MAEKLKIEIEVDSKTGEARIKGLGQEMESAGKKGKAGFTSAATGAESLTRKLGPAGSMLLKIGGAVGGLLILRKGFSELNSTVSESISLANVQEAAETDLQATLTATGGAAGYNLEQLKKMAAGMQAATTVGDELTLGGMSIMATFKNVRGEGFERATRSALDMSQVMKTDLKSSVLQIGKALNDPAAGLTMLTRAGVTFTEQQKEQIKILQESGDTVGAQNIILKELETQFGGAAKAARETFGGAVKASQNALGDMKEELGFVITKNQFFIDLIQMAEKQFMRWGQQIRDNREYLMNLAKGGVLKVVDGITIALEAMRFFHNGWLGIKLVGSASVAAIAIGIETLVKGLRVMMFGWDALFDSLVKLGVMKVNPFDSMVKGLERFSASSMDVTKSVWADIEKTNAGYDSAKKAIGDWRSAIEKIPVTQAKAAESVIKSVQAVADEAVASQKDMAKAERERIAAVVRDLKLEEKARIEAGKKALAVLVARKKAEDDAAKSSERLRQKTADDKVNYRKLLIQAGKDSDNFVLGVRSGFMDMQDSATRFGDVGYDVFRTFSQSASSMVENNFFNLFTGRMDQLTIDWRSMWNDMARTASKRMSEIATNKAIDAAVSGVDWLGTAMGWWAAGTWDVKKEHLAVLHPHEMVLPADVAESIRRDAEGGGNDSLGESLEARSYAAGSFGANIESAVRDSLFGSVRGFALNKAIGLADTGNFVMGANPIGIMVSFAKAMISGIMAEYTARQQFSTIYGKGVAFDPYASALGNVMPYGKISLEDMQKNFGMWGFGKYDPHDWGDADTGGSWDKGNFGDYEGSDSMGRDSNVGYAHKGGRLNLRNDEGFFIGQRGEEVVTEKNLNRFEKLLSSLSSSGNAGGSLRVEIPVILDGREITRLIYNRSKSGEPVVHTRGITDK